MFSKDGVGSSGLPEYVMCFQPPLVVHNVLPYPITVILQDSTYQAEPSQFTIGVGGFVEVYQFDMSRKIRMSIKLEVRLSALQVQAVLLRACEAAILLTLSSTSMRSFYPPDSEFAKHMLLSCNVFTLVTE